MHAHLAAVAHPTACHLPAEQVSADLGIVLVQLVKLHMSNWISGITNTGCGMHACRYSCMFELASAQAKGSHLANFVEQDRVHELLLDVPVGLLGCCTAWHGADHWIRGPPGQMSISTRLVPHMATPT